MEGCLERMFLYDNVRLLYLQTWETVNLKSHIKFFNHKTIATQNTWTNDTQTGTLHWDENHTFRFKHSGVPLFVSTLKRLSGSMESGLQELENPWSVSKVPSVENVPDHPSPT